jgi:hypothetical protein
MRGAEPPAQEPMPQESPEEEPAPMEEIPAPEEEPAPPSPGELVIPEAPPVEEAQAPEPITRYTVKEGDTLWDITRSVLNNPFLWPKVWRNNPYILNPDLIYPGNVIIITPEGVVVEEAPPAAPPVEAEAPIEVPEEVEEVPPVEEEVAAVPPVPVPPAPEKPKPDLALLASAGFIMTGEEPSGTVISGQDNRELLGEGQIAYILPNSKATLAMGDRLTLYRHVRKVYHPKTRKYLGDLIKILGTAEITESEERVKTAQILDSYDYITKGDLALPYEPLELAAPSSGESETAASQPGSLQGYIVEIKDERVSTAQSDIVYLDLGMKHGLKVGDRFTVVRQGEKTSRFSPGRGERLPKQVIGRLEILLLQDATSTARIIESTDAIYKGDEFESPPMP